MGKSSKDKRDAYYRLAKEQGWRARSAFKLLQLDEAFDLFDNVRCVVDLCAAPGSWSQVLSRVLVRGERIGRAAWTHRQTLGKTTIADVTPLDTMAMQRAIKIVAIDLQPMSPLEGITCLKADITHPSTVPRLLLALRTDMTERTDDRPVDLVLSDGAPDVTGLHDLDIYVQSQLLWAALNLATHVLKPGGKFVAKIFRSKDVDILYAQLSILFDQVVVAKPRSSRASSVEAFVICLGFRAGHMGDQLVTQDKVTSSCQIIDESRSPAQNMAPMNPLEDQTREFGLDCIDILRPGDSGDGSWVAPFLACGDLSAYDADASHKLPVNHVSLDPVQPPTAPPYRRALHERRRQGGAYGRPD